MLLQGESYYGIAAYCTQLWVRVYYDPTPDAPTNCAATDGTYNDKVTVTWTKSTGATGYRVYRDDVDVSGLLGDVATWDDTGADAPVITPGSTVATDGDHTDKVALSISGGPSVANGTTHTYKVTAECEGCESGYSNEDTGYRGHGSIAYQWQRSSGDADSDYSNISGATSSTYDDTDAPDPVITDNGQSVSAGTYSDRIKLSVDAEIDIVGRYYRCYLTADGATPQYSTADRGYVGDNAIGYPTYQWQHSSVDADSDYSNMSGATTPVYVDKDVSVFPSGRYYKCVVTATGASNSPLTTTAARGYCRAQKAPRHQVDIVIKNPDGDTLAYCMDVEKPSTDYRSNQLAVLEFTIPADSSAAQYCLHPNEAWLYKNGVLQDIFCFADKEAIR
jgi:hypothetical protein